MSGCAPERYEMYIEEPSYSPPQIEQKAPIHKVEEEAAKIAPEVTPTLIPRTIVTLWDSKYEKDIFFTTSNAACDLPLNYLGLKLEYIDLQQPLPDLSNRNDVLGILCWLPGNYNVARPTVLVRWLLQNIEEGKKAFITEHPSISSVDISSKLYEKFGLEPNMTWPGYSYLYQIHYQDPIYDFERPLPLVLPDFSGVSLTKPDTRVLLSIAERADPDTVIPINVVTDAGFYGDADFILFKEFQGDGYIKKWFLNPFALFKLAFTPADMPIPDPSTIAGRRAYFSHIDGDGWNNQTLVADSHAIQKILCPEIILDQIIKPNPDLPVTVGPIAANLDLNWNGSEDSEKLARLLFEIPHVEVGCHTYSHPYDWRFFENYIPQNEIPYLSRYSTTTWQITPIGEIRKVLQQRETFYKVEEEKTGKPPPSTEVSAASLYNPHFFTPRAYATKPFDLKLDIFGAIREIDRFAPPPKKVLVYQWSGNTLTWKKAINMTVEADVRNINGGDPRFDFLRPSYTYLCGLARRLGKETQVLTCSANENVYTDGWIKNYYAQFTLPTTLEWSETPLRVKALNLYYHMYSGERIPSLSALKKNIDYIKTQQIAPIPTSLYCDAVDGFFSSEISSLGEKKWQIQKRGRLQTFRFDHAAFESVDFTQSQGIIGQKHYQGSLYVYLDGNHENPVIALKETDISYAEPDADRAYLIDSRWRVWGLEFVGPAAFSFQTSGFGPGEALWKVPEEGIYKVKLMTPSGHVLDTQTVQSNGKELHWVSNYNALIPIKVEIQSRGSSNVSVNP